MAFPPALEAAGSAQLRCHMVEAGADLRAIDGFVSQHRRATPFHRPEWMQAITRATGHSHCYALAEDGEGKVRGILPLHKLHSALFGRALLSSGFAVGGGILAETPAAARLLANAAIGYAKQHSFPTIELRGGMLPGGEWQEKNSVYAGFVAPLAEDDEAQLLAVPRKQRAEVRKGLSGDLRVTVGRDLADRTAHYRVYAQSVHNLGTPVFPKALFDAVLDGFGEDADILTVWAGDNPAASVLSLYHLGTVMPYWGGGTSSARWLRANDVMYYALMNHARRRGCRQFDFGRSKVGTGAFAFKKNWGFTPEPLSYAIWTADGAEPRDVNPLSPKYRLQIALWQRLPLPIANLFGPWIARGLG